MLDVVFGCLVLNPFTAVVEAFFHPHVEGHVHLHWHDVWHAVQSSFIRERWPHLFVYAVMSGLVGLLLGKTFGASWKIREQLERFSMIGMNASSIAHDLDNPLVVVTMHARALGDELSDSEQLADCEAISHAARQITRLVDDIRMAARGQGGLRLDKQSTKLGPFVERVLSKMSLTSKVDVRCRFEDEVPVDEHYFERVIWNLVKNADEALKGREDGEVSVAIDGSDSAVTLTISDNGPGIDRQHIKSLFEVGRTFGKRSGSGFGLSNCRKIVEAHGGKIWVESKPGRGAAFLVLIPC